MKFNNRKWLTSLNKEFKWALILLVFSFALNSQKKKPANNFYTENNFKCCLIKQLLNYNITTWSNTIVTRIKEMINKDKIS